MGRRKDYQIEQDEMNEQGYMCPERGKKHLCSSHYRYSFLKKYIDSNGSDGVFDYCGRHTKVLDLSDFIEHVGGQLADWLEGVDNANLYLDSLFDDDEIPGFKKVGGYIAPDDADCYDSTSEVVEDFSLISDHNALNNDVESCLYMERKIRRDPTTMILGDELSLPRSEKLFRQAAILYRSFSYYL